MAAWDCLERESLQLRHLLQVALMVLSSQSTLELSDGNRIPLLGFGTYELDGMEAYNAVTWALEAGYRHIDSATWYENEKECGTAILDFCKSTGTPRSAIFYTTKLKLNDGYDATLKAIDFSLDQCGLGYIDLYLIHGPIGGKTARTECWRAICDAQKEGKLRSIGVSTFGVRHLKEILDMGLAIPTVHQIDLHPFMARTEIVKICKENHIALEAWAPLVRGLRFNHPVIQKIATKYHKQPAQVLLRYSLQKNYVAIPKSSSKTRIVANLDIFDFELEEGEMLDLDQLDEGLVTDWDPTGCP
ncbi:Aldo-keto reductase [Mycena indigotica]|uniref:Aldo-keto reductase n=1 Tax=Mycena indigotica TaxID=2126181 RepID=A0A8H6WH01_9AGAR|nr:Aldo-keto reductase [Mycena indigotica]KAF7311994.1 Aldo-keto reductase [Mycena indigotica]